MNWHFLVCDCGSAMAKPHWCYQVWICPDCGRSDGWGDSSKKVGVDSGHTVKWENTTVNYQTINNDYRYRVWVVKD